MVASWKAARHPWMNSVDTQIADSAFGVSVASVGGHRRERRSRRQAVVGRIACARDWPGELTTDSRGLASAGIQFPWKPFLCETTSRTSNVLVLLEASRGS